MPRHRGTRLIDPSPVPAPAPADETQDELPEGIDPIEFQEEQKIREIFSSEDSATAQLEISRRNKFSGTWGYIFRMPLNEWGPEVKEKIAQSYGGGEYKAKVRRMGDGVRGQMGPSFTFDIDTSLVPLAERDKSAAARGGSSSPDFMLQMMQMQQQQMDKMAMMQQQASDRLLTMLTTVFGRPPPPGPSDKLVEVLATRALAPPPSLNLEAVAGLTTTLGRFVRPHGGGGDGAGEPSDKTDNLLRDVLQALPELIRMAQTLFAPPPAAPINVTGTAAPPAPRYEATSASPTAPAPVPPSPVANPQEAQLKVYLPVLYSEARKGTAPELLIEQVLDEQSGVPDETVDQLEEFFTSPDWLARCLDAYEPFAALTPWLTGFREKFLAALSDGDTAEMPPSASNP